MYLIWAGLEEFVPVKSKGREAFFLLNSLSMVICKG